MRLCLYLETYNKTFNKRSSSLAPYQNQTHQKLKRGVWPPHAFPRGPTIEEQTQVLHGLLLLDLPKFTKWRGGTICNEDYFMMRFAYTMLRRGVADRSNFFPMKFIDL